MGKVQHCNDAISSINPDVVAESRGDAARPDQNPPALKPRDFIPARTYFRPALAPRAGFSGNRSNAARISSPTLAALRLAA